MGLRENTSKMCHLVSVKIWNDFGQKLWTWSECDFVHVDDSLQWRPVIPLSSGLKWLLVKLSSGSDLVESMKLRAQMGDCHQGLLPLPSSKHALPHPVSVKKVYSFINQQKKVLTQYLAPRLWGHPFQGPLALQVLAASSPPPVLVLSWSSSNRIATLSPWPPCSRDPPQEMTPL